MAKKEVSSSEIDFIKEVEQLKIKQKLLIESLKRKKSDQQNKLFLEINSKLDFLVNIFNEANKTDEAKEENNEFSPILEKIDELSETLNTRLEKIEENLFSNKLDKDIKQENKEEKTQEIKPQASEEQPIKAPPVTTNQPPEPEFESKIENPQKDEKKKKKWF